ncbi:polysaccharide pyruvyl transferase family protein [Nitratireductor soli]|uniref:polysaccharide pyruvyl transferase family protein n=1 Tax=Nitratireductor soli TaxID=1670619 RepID=UPI000A5A174C|nr:polysaccharide pyruvyl transferase family protein [Nitratireductor soli]
MKVLVFNVRYSPNLGDGILALCLENALRRAAPELTVETIDLAGRETYDGAGDRRRLALTMLGWLPSGIRRLLVERALARRLDLLKKAWLPRIAAADAVVIGGGNLFQDDDLNFPLKVGAVLECARQVRRPVGVFAVGVGGHWSKRAQTLFGQIRACKVFHLSVRDKAAGDNWRRHFDGWRSAKILPDPGLLARDLIAAPQPGGGRGAPMIGICVTHPVILRRHSEGGRGSIPLLKAAQYGALVRWLSKAGCRVTLFTNGATEDQRFLESIARKLPAGAARLPGLTVAPPPRTPEDLVALIGTFDAVAAHRLHACIVAYALAVPHVGFGWDRKVESFFRAVGRERFFLSGKGVGVEQIGGCILAAMRDGIAEEAHARHFIEARAAVALLARDLAAAVEPAFVEQV